MKFGLIAFGNEESYGLLFVGGEIIKLGKEVRFFDAEEQGVVDKVVEWGADYVCFSPMTTFYPSALEFARQVKGRRGNVISVWGGHHASSFPEIVNDDGVDIVVVGPVRGTIERILAGETGIVRCCLTDPADMVRPARKECYNDVPRMRNRYRKVMISMMGCPWNCAYCSSSTSHLQEIYGVKDHRKYFLARRPVSAVMEEAKEMISLGSTAEIEWGDDEVFYGDDVETWIPEFVEAWEREIGLPMYVQITSAYALKVSDHLLMTMKRIVNVAGMGIQAIRPESLKIFNRSWDSEEKMKKAYDRLVSFGYSVNMQAIVGLPVDDPVEDAMDTIKGIQRIGSGSVCSVYPLVVFPGTAIDKMCREKKLVLNDLCTVETNTGIPSINFAPADVKRLRNICKLGTFFVKYNIDERWMRALIDIDLDDATSAALSMNKYYECVSSRLKEKGREIFGEIEKTMKLRY